MLGGFGAQSAEVYIVEELCLGALRAAGAPAGGRSRCGRQEPLQAFEGVSGALRRPNCGEGGTVESSSAGQQYRIRVYMFIPWSVL